MQGKTKKSGSDGTEKKLPLCANIEHTGFKGESHRQTAEDEGGGFL